MKKKLISQRFLSKMVIYILFNIFEISKYTSSFEHKFT